MVGNKTVNYPFLISLDEAVELEQKYGMSSTLKFVHKISARWYERSKYPYSDWDHLCMLACLFDAGRIQGIREERLRRKKGKRAFQSSLPSGLSDSST